jgi:hypothetical protein
VSGRFLPISLVVLVCLLAGVAGYVAPTESPALPVRIKFDSTGGVVIFSHQAHAEDYGVFCEDCHHADPDPSDPVPCQACHARSFDEEYVRAHPAYLPEGEACQACHHAEPSGLNYDHDQHAADYNSDCTDCHHGPDIEPELQDCSVCHIDSGDEEMPSLKNAAHQRCIICHAETFEAGLSGCGYCHDFTPTETVGDPRSCATCHERSVSELIPTYADAYHRACRGCHEEQGLGPWREESCNDCHIR